MPVLVWCQLLIARLILLSPGQTFGHVGPCEKAAYGRQVGTILSGPRGLSNVGLHKKLQINSWTNISVLRFPEIVDGCALGVLLSLARGNVASASGLKIAEGTNFASSYAIYASHLFLMCVYSIKLTWMLQINNFRSFRGGSVNLVNANNSGVWSK